MPPLKRSVLMVSEAMDMVEEFTSEAAELLEQAKIVAAEARKIANIPHYLNERLVCLITDIERMDWVRIAIRDVRESLDNGAVNNEGKRIERGGKLSLVA